VRGVLIALFAELVCIASPLAAQSAGTGRLEGTITDSVHARPLASASVLAIRVDTQPSASAGATTDARGRYRLDSLPAGRYIVEFASAFLDSLEIIVPPREVTIVAGQMARADFALPSGRTLRAAACPGLTLPPETGAVVGRVVDADTDEPLVGATIAAAWYELSVDRTTLQPSNVQKSGAVPTDSLGRYRLCGVPTDSWLVVQVQHRGRAGSEVNVMVPDSAGVFMRHLSLSTASSYPIATSPAASADTGAASFLSGTASISGVVRGVGGLPLAEAQVRVLGAQTAAVSDGRGRYALGDLPSGTQVLEVRRLGYLLAKQPVDLRAGRPVAQEVRLQRIVTLDSMRVLAQRSRYREFEEHRKRGGFGTFLAAEDIERRHPFQASDLFWYLPGFKVTGFGLDAKVVSARGMSSLMGGQCVVNVVIDGMQNQDINLIHPSTIGAMEVYREGQPAPVQYRGSCGVIVIWSKR
jgi:hypothetical protein